MAKRHWLLVACQIGRSALANECIFHMLLPDGGDYIGAVPREYCYTRAGKRLDVDQPGSGKVLSGFVAAMVIRAGAQRVLVTFPDGAVEVVRKDQLAFLARRGAGRALQRRGAAGANATFTRPPAPLAPSLPGRPG